MKYKVLFFLSLVAVSGWCQNVIAYHGENINALDEDGRQTGIWKLFDENNHIMITMEFKDGKIVSDTQYFKDGVLIASYKGNDKLDIYKDKHTIHAWFTRRADGGQTLTDAKGKELTAELLTYFYSSGQVGAMNYVGKAQLYDFIGKHIDYSAIGDKRGTVIVEFTIDATGRTSDIKIAEGPSPELNKEAMRVVSILPRWQPGHQGGAFVKTLYRIPITLK